MLQSAFSVVIVFLLSVVVAGEDYPEGFDRMSFLSSGFSDSALRRFGGLVQGIDVGLSRAQERRLLEIGNEFRDQNFLMARAGELKADRYYEDHWKPNRDKVTKMNGELLLQVDEMLPSKRQKRRFREVATQINLQNGNFASAVFINGFERKLKRSDVEKMVELTDCFDRDMGDEAKQQTIAYALQKAGLTVEKLSAMMGDRFDISLPQQRPAGTAKERNRRDYYDDTPLRLLRSAKVQVEIEMTLDQVRKAKATSLDKFSMDGIANYKAPPARNREFIFSVARDELKSVVSTILNSDQQSRFNELLVQSYVHNMQPAEVLGVLRGKYPDIARSKYEIRIEDTKTYFRNAHRLRNGISSFSEIIGSKQNAASSVGKISLPVSMREVKIASELFEAAAGRPMDSRDAWLDIGIRPLGVRLVAIDFVEDWLPKSESVNPRR